MLVVRRVVDQAEAELSGALEGLLLEVEAEACKG